MWLSSAQMSRTPDLTDDLAQPPTGGVGAESMLDAVRQIAEEIHAGTNVTDIMRNLVHATVKHGPWPQAWVGLFDDQHRETLHSYQAGFTEESSATFLDWPLENSPSSMAIRSRQPVVIPDVETWEAYPYMQTAGPPVGMRSAVYVPIPVDGLWMVMAVNRRQPHRFGSAELSLARIIASFAALAFRSVIMRDDAVETARTTNDHLSRLNATITVQNAELQRMAQVRERLVRLQLESGGTDELCAAMSDLLGTPVVLLDRLHQVSGAAGVPRDEADQIASDYTTRLAESPRDVAHPSVELTDVGDRPLLVGRARDEQVVVGTLLALWHGTEVSGVDTRVMEQGCLHVTLDVLRQRADLAAQIRLQQDFAAAVLASGGSPVEVSRRASLLGIRLDVPAQILRGRVSGAPGDILPRDASELSGLVQRRLAEARINAVVAPVGDADFVAVLLADGGSAPATFDGAAAVIRRSVLDGLASLFGIGRSTFTISIGSGTTGTGVAALRASHAEARRALEVMISVGNEGGDLTIADAGSYSILSATSDHDRNEFVERYLRPLLDYDAVHGGGLIETLRTYFEVVGNVQRTAEVMFLHISTVRYRLSRIETIADVSLRDEEDRLCLQIALRVVGITRPSTDAGR